MNTKSYSAGLLLLLVLAMAGCAKEEVVKKDEALAPQQTVQPQVAKQQAPVQSQTTSPGDVKSQQQESATDKANKAALLETVYFDFDKSDLKKETRDVLAKDAEQLMKALATSKVQIAGHCDERGSDEYNLALGERRAKSVKSYLVTLGVAADRLSTISYGKERPAVQGHDEAAWAKNRRAEFVVVQ